jgi:hypothetical protein
MIKKRWPSLTNKFKKWPSLGLIDEKEMTITSKWKGDDHHYQMRRRRWPLSRPIDEKKTLPHSQYIWNKQMSSSQWPTNQKKEMNIIRTSRSKERNNHFDASKSKGVNECHHYQQIKIKKQMSLQLTNQKIFTINIRYHATPSISNNNV